MKYKIKQNDLGTFNIFHEVEKRKFTLQGFVKYNEWQPLELGKYGCYMWRGKITFGDFESFDEAELFIKDLNTEFIPLEKIVNV